MGWSCVAIFINTTGTDTGQRTALDVRDPGPVSMYFDMTHDLIDDDDRDARETRLLAGGQMAAALAQLYDLIHVFLKTDDAKFFWTRKMDDRQLQG